MGGSMKGRRAAAREQREAEQAEAIAMTAAPDPQTGQVVTHPDDAPTPKEVQASKQAALEQQFADADAKAIEAVQDATLFRAVRGY